MDNNILDKLRKMFGNRHLRTPILLLCKSDAAWLELFEREKTDYAYIDAPNMTYAELRGKNYPASSIDGITLYEPEWYKKLTMCGVLVINDLDTLEYERDNNKTDNATPSRRTDYDFLLRRTDERDEYRQVHDGLYVPTDAVTILIGKNGKFDDHTTSRCSVVKLDDENI